MIQRLFFCGDWHMFRYLAPTMNVFHLSCRNLRLLSMLFLGVLLSYAVINIVYISLLDSSSPVGSLTVDDNDVGGVLSHQSVSADLKLGKPDANGKVEIVLSLDMKQLASLLGQSGLDKLLPEELEGQPEAPLKLTGSPPKNISFVMHDPTLCASLDKSSLHWIVAVNSVPANFEKRKVLRETWANTDLFRNQVFTTIFLIGLTEDSNVQEGIEKEFNEHRDMVQGNFFDTHRNETMKVLMALQYVVHHCPNVNYMIKANDDTFLNIFEMMRLMESARSHPFSVICPLWQDNSMRILRDPKTCMEWCVKDDELPGRSHFPQYCAGAAFSISKNLVSALLEESRSTPYFWIDDVYITGLVLPRVAARESVHYSDIMRNFTQVEKDIESAYLNKSRPITLILSKMFNLGVHQRTWKALMTRLEPSQVKVLSDKSIAGL